MVGMLAAPAELLIGAGTEVSVEEQWRISSGENEKVRVQAAGFEPGRCLRIRLTCCGIVQKTKVPEVCKVFSFTPKHAKDCCGSFADASGPLKMAVKQEKEDGSSPAVSKVKRPGSGLAPPAAAAQALRASDAAASASGAPPPAPLPRPASVANPRPQFSSEGVCHFQRFSHS